MSELIRTIGEMKRTSREWRAAGRTVGFVPTMGALHAGHLSLLAKAREETDRLVLSLFVNPTQFGPGEDFESYPRDLEGDLARLEEFRVDAVFAPAPETVYGPGFDTWVCPDRRGQVLCGAQRPGHFRGVATIVAKLFHIVLPHRAYFGEKDFQQAVIIRQMVADLDMDVEVVTVPTAREADGLALSSRNLRLTDEERERAPALHRALHLAGELVGAGERDASKVVGRVREFLGKVPGLHIEYVAVVHPVTLDRVTRIEGEIVVALACRLGAVRLIDNLRIRC